MWILGFIWYNNSSNKPNSVFSQWCSKTDHSPIGDKMLVVDGSCGANRRVWYKTVTVSSNTDYYFSGWASPNTFDFDYSLYIPLLRVRINGTNILQNFSVPWNPIGCSNWQEFFASWNSGTATTALIEIYDDNINDQANDFSLDDLFFANCERTTDQVTVTVGSSTPVITPSGPITYYNEYESPQQLVLTSTPAMTYQWYKNNVAISGATNQTYTINFIGINALTDYYKVVNSCGGTSNIVTFNYIGCDNPNDYPVAIPGVYCVSTLPLTLTAPNLGAGTIYSWWATQSTQYSFSTPSGNTCQMSAISPYNPTGIYTKSAKNGQETYMYYVTVGNSGCRIMNPENTYRRSIDIKIIPPKAEKTQLLPNPARSTVTIRSASGIIKLELYNNLGKSVWATKGNGSNSMMVNITKLPNGIYVCKVLSKNGQETLELVIQR